MLQVVLVQRLTSSLSNRFHLGHRHCISLLLNCRSTLTCMLEARRPEIQWLGTYHPIQILADTRKQYAMNMITLWSSNIGHLMFVLIVQLPR